MNGLSGIRSWLLVAAIFAAARCGGAYADELAAAVAQSPAGSGGSTGVLLLHDGGVLTGEITRSGERYLLRRGGSEIEVDASKASFVCGSLLEAYDERRKRALQPSPDVDAHLAMADWCLRNNLLPQAARELMDARGSSPDHPRIVLLERRLASASAPRPVRLAARPQPVRQASAEEPVPLSDDMLHSSQPIGELPDSAIERFTRKVQPILVNNCTTAGCHQPNGKQSFQLDRALLRGLANRRATQRNLAATLALVDRSQPHLSSLLTVPRRVHGGMQAPIFGPRHATVYSHLVEWVRLVTQTESPDGQSASSASAGQSANPAADEAAESSDALAARDAHLHELATTAAIGSRDQEPAARGPLKRSVRVGARLAPWQPADEFDPEIFNRQQRRPVAANNVDTLRPISSE